MERWQNQGNARASGTASFLLLETGTVLPSNGFPEFSGVDRFEKIIEYKKLKYLNFIFIVNNNEN
jgi:hypothetical protein